jgi:hypothetical protein
VLELFCALLYVLTKVADPNSGKVKVKGEVKDLGLKLPGGSGCAPDWDTVVSYSKGSKSSKDSKSSKTSKATRK